MPRVDFMVTLELRERRCAGEGVVGLKGLLMQVDEMQFQLMDGMWRREEKKRAMEKKTSLI